MKWYSAIKKKENPKQMDGGRNKHPEWVNANPER